MKRFLFVSLLILASCTSNPSVLVADFEVAEKYGGVAVFSLKADEAIRQSCGSVCDVNVVDVEDFAAALREADAFDTVAIGGTEQDLGIAIATSVRTQRPTEIAVTTLLLWRGQRLGELTHNLPYPANSRARSEAGASPIARSIVSHVIRDTTWQRLFTPERVHDVLEASNYAESLDAPQNAGSFRRYDIHKFFDPLLGVAIRYRHAEPENGHIDVFVYPVRAAGWTEAESILKAESVSVRRDLDRLLGQGVHKLVRLRDDELIHMTGPNGSVQLIKFEGELANADFQPYDTSTYVYLSEDKLVKVRATRPRNALTPFDADEFVRSLVMGLRVPEESAYMRQVRQHWRDNPPDQE